MSSAVSGHAGERVAIESHGKKDPFCLRGRGVEIPRVILL